MAHLRLLSAVAIVTLLATTTACALGPIYARRIEGKVIEKGTGKPVAGAEVFSSYEVVYAGGNRVDSTDWRWATTGEDGSFAIPGHIKLILGPPGSYTESYPNFEVVHRDYGVSGDGFTGRAAEDFPGWRNIVLEIERGPGKFAFEKTSHWAGLCSGMSEDACDRMCVVAYGSLEACYEGGRFPPERR